ncbi:MAG: hypothetical protein ACREIM_03400 [Nitrospiraceae bacterium]
MEGNTVLITGASKGIGYKTATPALVTSVEVEEVLHKQKGLR